MKKSLLLLLVSIFASSTWAQNTITTGTITGSPFCGGASVSVPYTATGSFGGGNVFTAQLSNHQGEFTSPVNIGTLASTGSGTISATIPLGTKSGTKYRVRIVSSSPSITGAANTKNLKINPKPGGTNTTNITACAVTLNWNDLSNASSYKVRYKKTSDANYSSTISLGDVNTYTFTGLAGSTSYEFDVRSVCANGELSDWKKVKNVSTTAVAVPTGATVFPGGTGATTATLDWNDMPCAASYKIRYRIIGETTWDETTSTASTKILTDLFPATDYEAQVATVTAAGSESAYGFLLQWGQGYRLDNFSAIAPEFGIYPNPSNGTFTVSLKAFDQDTDVEITVQNMYGQVVYTSLRSLSAGMNEEMITLEGMSGGMYLVKIASGERVFETPLLVK